MLRQSSGVSVIGRSINSTGNVADITASSDGQYLKRVNGILGFNSIGISDLPNSGVSAGTFNNITVNTKGLVTSATNKDYTTNQTISISGDATGSGSSGIALTLATVNGNVGTFNNLTVNGKGLVTAATNKDFITNQTITLSGDATGSGSSGIALTLSNNSISNAKFRQSSGVSIVGRSVNSTGNVADIVASSDGQVLKRVGGVVGFNSIGISDLPNSGVSAGTFNNVTVNTKGLVTSALLKDYTTNQAITLSGDVTGSGSSGIATTIATNIVSNTKFRQSVGVSVVGRSINSTGNVADIAASSDGQVLKRVNGVVGFNSIGTNDLNNSVVTYAKIQNVNGNRLLGNVGNLGIIEEIQTTSGLFFSGTTLSLSNSLTTYKYNAGSAPTQLTATKVFTGTATTNSSGVATFQVTSDGTASGNALFTNIFSIAVNARNNTSTSTSVPNASVKAVTSGKTIDVNVTSGVVLLVLSSTQIFVGAGIVVDITVIGN